MLASSFLDPVLGLDIHFEMVPTPAPVPLPIPNPFIGIVFDPVGLAAGIAIGAAIGAVVGAPFQGPVLYWTAFPATNTGTEAKHVPGHILIPPGTAWAPFPKTPKPVIHPGETPTPALPVKPENDAVVITGSKTVTVMGSNAVRLGDLALSCSEPLRLPSSVVLAVPKGAPILIGGPMSLDIMAALLASLRTRFVSDSLHALVSRLKPSRFRNLLHRAVCFFTGHPVDVASGKVMTEFVDAELPGPMPLKVERIYSSAFARRSGMLGHGWSLSLDQAVWRERGKVVLQAEDGREVEFDTFDFPGHRIEPGQRVYHPIERLTLHCEDEGAWRIVDRDGVVRRFAPVPERKDGRAMIQAIVSRCGHHQIAFHYGTEGTARGRLQWVRDSSGRFLHLAHDEHGRLSELHLPQAHEEGFGLHRRYEHDAAGDLVRVTDPQGHAWSFAYVTHLLTQETDRNGHSYYFQYDGLGEDAWCVRTWGDGGVHDHTLAYDKKQRVTYVTDSQGHTTQYHMNLVGQVVKIVDPLGAETTYEYDPSTLKQTKEVDALGRVSAYQYDGHGNVVAVSRPDGTDLRLAYDEHDRLALVTDPGGREWSWRYDDRGRVVERRNADGTETHFGYEHGHLASVRDTQGGVARITRDEHGMPSRIQAADGATVSMRYDGLGRTIERTNPLGHVQRRSYDASGRPLEIHESHGNVRRLSYDPEGNVVRDHDAQGDIRFEYEPTGQVRARSEGGTTIHFGYDSERRLESITNELGAVHRYERDERGELTAEIDFDGARRAYQRDAEGQLVVHRSPCGRAAIHRYDPAGRVTEIEYDDGTKDLFRYREDGELVEASNADVTVRFDRDELGRVRREHQGEQWVESTFTPLGFRSSLRTSLGATQTFERNALGDVVRMRAWTGGPGTDLRAPQWEARVERDLLGQERERHLPGSTRSHWARDELGRGLRHQLGDGHTLHRDVSYEWGVDGHVHRTVDRVRDRSTRYGYTETGTLAWAQRDHGELQLRLPDAAGHLFKRRDLGDRQHAASGRVVFDDTSGGPRRYVYDDDGNLVEKHEPDGGQWRYEWSAAGNLVRVERPDGKVVELVYDALGRRVRKHFDGTTTHWVWDGDSVVHEWSEGTEAGPDEPESLVTWVFEPGTFAPAAKLAGGVALSVIDDLQGAPAVMLDASGAPVWAIERDVFGNTQDLEAADGLDAHSCPFRWPGQYEDPETGLFYNRHRYYDPGLGHYISPDRLGFRAGLRRYSYVPDPLTTVDALGLITGPPYDFGELMNAARNDLDFSTPRDGAVFWSGPRMADAQAWATANGRSTLEQTRGGRVLDGLNLFDPGSGITGAQAAEVWDAASLRFAQGASGEVNVFSTGSRRMNPWGNLRTWWRVERPALLRNPDVDRIVRRRKDGAPCR